MGIWAPIQAAWNAGGKLLALLRLARDLRKDADARICLGFKRQQEILSERLREAQARGDASEEQRARRLLHGVQDNELSYHQSRIVELAAHVLADRAPSGAIGPDLPNLPEPEREGLDTAATALQALGPVQSFERHFLLGNAFYTTGDYPKALQEYNAALALRPDDPAALTNRAAALIGLERYEETLADCDRCLELRPDDPTTLTNRAGALIGLKRYEEALADCDRSLQLRPDHPDTLNNRAVALRHLQRYEDVLADYNRALELRRDDATILSNRGLALAYLQRYEEALADFNRALQLRPDHTGTMYNVACLYSLWRRYDESLEWLEKAIARDATFRARAAEDEDFAGLRAHPQFGPRFQKLISEGSS